MAGFVVKLYGTNIEITGGETPDRLTIASEGTDLETLELQTEGLYPSYELGSAENYGGKQFSSNEIKIKYQLKTVPFAFPTDAISVYTYYNLAFFKKKYHYLDTLSAEVDGFPIFTDANNSDLCHRIAITGIGIEHKNDIGAKVLTLDIEKGETV